MRANRFFFIMMVLAGTATVPARAQQAAPSSAPAAVRGYAMLVRPPFATSQLLDSARENLARALATNDRRLLRATPAQYLQAIQRLAPEAELTDTAQLADYIRSLTALQCPQGATYPMSRIIASDPTSAGRLDLSGNWSRHFPATEPCLYDNNLARHIMSLACGNVIIPGPTTSGTVRPAQAPAVTVPSRVLVAAAPQIQQPAPFVPRAAQPPAPAPRPPDTVFVRGAPPHPVVVFQPTRFIHPPPAPQQPAPQPQVIVVRERSWVAPVLVTTALGVATYFIVRANDRSRRLPVPGPGGPVNPPN